MASKRAKAALGSGLGLVAFTTLFLTAPWEGKRNYAYWDAIGKVWTVCYGETLNVKKGDYYTDAQCLAMLEKRQNGDFLPIISKCLKGWSGYPFSVKASFLDLSYNVGVGAVCNSTAGRRAATKNWAGACEAMTWFNKAGGRVIDGLDKRRKEGDVTRIGEREICLAGLE